MIFNCLSGIVIDDEEACSLVIERLVNKRDGSYLSSSRKQGPYSS